MTAFSKGKHGMSPDKLVYMANQIGKFFTSQPGDQAAAGIANHMAKFWEPRMRQAIQTHVAQGGAGLDPDVLKAVESLPKVN